MYFLKKIFFQKSRSKQDEIFYSKLSSLLEFAPKNIQLYQEAFTHRSANKTDANGKKINYERLEFLGDAVLSNIVALYLFRKAPNADEGTLTKMRSKIVSREYMNDIGQKLNLTELLYFSSQQKNTLGNNIHGNLTEALIGAIYLDKGFAEADFFVQNKIIREFKNISLLENKISSYKSTVLEYCQKKKYTIHFDTTLTEKVDDNYFFVSTLYINHKEIAKAEASSKKKAEEKVSKMAYAIINEDM